jgi:hypothetical protein
MTARPDALARRTPSHTRRLATHSEVARLTRLDRHLVWTMRAGIDVSKTRAARLREIWGANLESWAPSEISRVNREKGEGRGKEPPPLSCDIRKVIFIGNAGNDQSLGQLLWTGVVPNETFRGSGKGGVSQCRLRRDPTLARGGLEHWP